MSVAWWGNEAGTPRKGSNFGVLTEIDSWAPSSARRRWLLIAGAMHPPASANPTAKVRASGERSGNFLGGTDLDFHHMAKVVKCDLYNKVQDMEIKVNDVTAHIKKFFEVCKESKHLPMLYFTGHGAAGSGDWCFADGRLSFSQVHDLLPGGTFYPWIFADCCFSGHWANLARVHFDGKIRVVAAAPYFMTALDDPDTGGHFTSYITGTRDAKSLLRPIVCSGLPKSDYPFSPVGYGYGYSDRVNGETSFGTRFVVAQHFYNDCCAFVVSTLPSYDWGSQKTACCVRSTHKGFLEWVDTQWSQDLRIMHCSCSGKAFGAYAIKGWGTDQSILSGTFDEVLQRMKQRWRSGFLVTSICPGIEHDWVVIMTKCCGDLLYGKSDGSQHTFSRTSWSATNSAIKEHWKEGRIVTALAVSKGVWFGATFQSPRGQSMTWGPEDGSFPNVKGAFSENNLDVTTILKDPSDGRWLAIATGGLNACNIGWWLNIPVRL